MQWAGVLHAVAMETAMEGEPTHTVGTDCMPQEARWGVIRRSAPFLSQMTLGDPPWPASEMQTPKYKQRT
jgi:hypothetical protein